MSAGMLKYYTDVLEPQFAKALFKESLDLFTSGERVWSSNYHWQGPLTKDTFPWYIRDYDKETADKILNALYDKGILTDREKEYDVMNYVGTRLSYIPWHNDFTWDEAVTIYLNEYWHEDWGGLFLYKDEHDSKEIMGYQPTFNTAVKQEQGETLGTWHTVTLVSVASQCPRVSIQIFPKERKNV